MNRDRAATVAVHLLTVVALTAAGPSAPGALAEDNAGGKKPVQVQAEGIRSPKVPLAPRPTVAAEVETGKRPV